MNARQVAVGAAVVLAVAVPVATIGAVALDDGSDAAIPLAAVVVAAFVAGGWLAGSPVDGAAAAVAAVVVAQAVSVVLQLAGDDDVNWAAVAANVVLAAVMGGLGGALSTRRRTGEPAT